MNSEKCGATTIVRVATPFLSRSLISFAITIYADRAQRDRRPLYCLIHSRLRAKRITEFRFPAPPRMVSLSAMGSKGQVRAIQVAPPTPI